MIKHLAVVAHEIFCNVSVFKLGALPALMLVSFQWDSRIWIFLMFYTTSLHGICLYFQ